MESDTFKTPPVLGGFGEKKSNNGTQWYLQNRVYDGRFYISCCLCEATPGGSQLYLFEENINGKCKK